MKNIYPDFLGAISDEKYFNITSAMFEAEKWLRNNWLNIVSVSDTLLSAVISAECVDSRVLLTTTVTSMQGRPVTTTDWMPLNSTTKCVLLIFSDIARDITVTDGIVRVTILEGMSFKDADIRDTVKRAATAYRNWMWQYNRATDILDGLDTTCVSKHVAEMYILRLMGRCITSVGGRNLLRALHTELFGIDGSIEKESSSWILMDKYFQKDTESAFGRNGILGYQQLVNSITTPLAIDDYEELKALQNHIDVLNDAQLRREAQRNYK